MKHNYCLQSRVGAVSPQDIGQQTPEYITIRHTSSESRRLRALPLAFQYTYVVVPRAGYVSSLTFWLTSADMHLLSSLLKVLLVTPCLCSPLDPSSQSNPASDDEASLNVSGPDTNASSSLIPGKPCHKELNSYLKPLTPELDR